MIQNLPSSIPISFSYNLFNYQFIPSRDCAMSQPISHWNLAMKARVQFQTSLWGICGGKRALGQADIWVIVKLWVSLRFAHLNFLGRNIHIKDSGCLCTDEEWYMWTSQQTHMLHLCRTYSTPSHLVFHNCNRHLMIWPHKCLWKNQLKPQASKHIIYILFNNMPSSLITDITKYTLLL